MKKTLIQHIFLFNGFSKTFSKPGLAKIELFHFLSFEWKTPIINCNILFNKDFIRAIFKTGNGKSENGNGERGTGNL